MPDSNTDIEERWNADLADLAIATNMLRIMLIALNQVHGNEQLPEGARMMLLAMGRAALHKIDGTPVPLTDIEVLTDEKWFADAVEGFRQLAESR